MYWLYKRRRAIGSLPDVKENGDTKGDAFYFSEGENRNAYYIVYYYSSTLIYD